MIIVTTPGGYVASIMQTVLLCNLSKLSNDSMKIPGIYVENMPLIKVIQVYNCIKVQTKLGEK